MGDLWSHSHDWDNGYCVGHKDGYQQGKNDAKIDLDEYEVSAEIEKQIKAEVIDEFKAEIKDMKSKAYQFLNTDYATGYISALSTLEGYAEQIKEKK